LRLVKTPYIVKRLYPKYVWSIPNNEGRVFLTFDDGPHPEITPKVLALLKQHNAKATFFLVGENAEKFPAVVQQILDEGHAIGNHTYNHLNGYKTSFAEYLNNTEKCAKQLASSLFRPPYGKLTRKQGKALIKANYRIIMWDVLSYDFDKTTNPEQCANNIIKHLSPGSIVVLHDSEKAEKNMLFALNKTLEYGLSKQFLFSSIKN
jgi:peptidoglycan-N-acetylglucosamine deacetylase